MFIDNHELVVQYYKLVKEKYPHLDFNKFKNVCNYPFKNLTNLMETKLTSVRLKYLGIFTIYPSRVKHLLENMKRNFKEDKIDSVNFFKRKKIYEEYLRKHQEYL